MKLHIITNEIDHNYNPKRYDIDLATGAINGYSDKWIFAGLAHRKHTEFIRCSDITAKTLTDLEMDNRMFFKNSKCQWKVRDIDHGTRREWGTEIMRIWVTE